MTEPNHIPGHDTTPAPKRLQRRYTEEDVQRGLTELALCRGNYRHAAARLAEQGHDIPGPTLQKWKDETHPERYAAIRDTLVPQIHAQIASQAEDAARQALDAQALAVELTHQQLEAGQVKQPSTVARDLATVAGIMIDKANVQRGRPTAITEHRDIAGILKSLEHQIPGVQAVDATAIEDTPDATSGEESAAPERVQ